jgi:serine/threonine protein kinase/thioredoxin-like negative regulator of GroEL
VTPARLQTIEEIFHAALDQEPDRVGAFLDTACEGDEVLRRKVEALLASHQQAGGFIETSAVGITTKIIENGQADLLVGRTIGHYKISKRIGTGGMGDVYLATDIAAGRKAALKLLPERFTGDAERLKRFQQEAHAVVGLNHPNILTIYEIGEDHSTHYIASELIEGETLRQRLMRGRMEVGETVDVAIQVASALSAAHETGIVHRDIKPENIMLRPDGYVKVLDFGIAKLAESTFAEPTADEAESVTLAGTNLGSILGTVRYMSPEQARGVQVDKRTDVWSLGVVLYEMVTGHAPFTGETPARSATALQTAPGEVMTSILEKEPPPLTSYLSRASAELQQIINQTLRKEREERYQSAHELLEAFQSLRRSMEFKTALERSTKTPLWLRWTRSPIASVLLLLVAALALALPFYWHRNRTLSSIPEKSIAVLPFENFSDNKENSYFAAGIQDDVLTSLAKIHELKVISRASVMAYQKPGGRNLREISQALGVANVLEGSVRRTSNRVLVNVQLIDARNDRHIWAERYDRAVADSIGLQGELAAEIAKVLQAKLDPEEKASLGTKPTNNPEAYVLYLRGLELEQNAETLKPPLLPTTEDWKAVAQLYAQAIALDPAFALARARASISYSQQFFETQDPALKAKARTLAEEALRLSPALGEAHLALGLFFYLTERDYTAALEQFTIALTALPNNVEVLDYIARIYRHQGRWRAAIGGFEQARSLNPRVEPWELTFTYWMVRDWRAAAVAVKQNLARKPDEPRLRVGLAQIEVVANFDLAAARAKLREIPAGVDPDGVVTLPNWNLSMLERDFATAEKWLADFPSDKFPGASPKSFYQAQTALARGDVELARTLFEKVRPALESNVRDHPAAARHHGALGILYGYMGRKEDAIRESRRAVELCPESTDAVEGVQRAYELALVYALTGETDQAVTLIERLLRTPGASTRTRFYDGGITQAELRLRWQWDKLRGDPRFKKLLEGPEPKTVY